MSEVKYTDYKREITITTLRFRKFTVNGMPTCLSWIGTKEHPREICKFLSTKKFGTAFCCRFSDVDLEIDEKSSFVIPNKDCPLWNFKK